MNKIICTNCNQEFQFSETFEIKGKYYTECPHCKVLFETDEELELGDEELEAVDNVQNAVYEMCKQITGDENLEYDISFIGEIADFSADLLTLRGHKVKYPAVVYEDNGWKHIELYPPESPFEPKLSKIEIGK